MTAEALRRRVITILAIAAVVAAAGLRFYNLAGESIWFDEAMSIHQAGLDFVTMIRATAADHYPPLHNLFLFASIHTLGDGEFAARLPSAIFGVLTVWVSYRLGRELFGDLVGVLAAWLVALAQFQIRYSQEARMYSIFAFFACLSVYCLVVQINRPSRTTTVAYVLATAAMLYTHLYAMFVLLAENAFLLFLLIARREPVRAWLGRWFPIQLAIVALFAPWLPIVVKRTMAAEGIS